MIARLSTTARGLTAGAITADGGAFAVAWSGAESWHVAIGTIIGSTVMLVAALVSPNAVRAK